MFRQPHRIPYQDDELVIPESFDCEREEEVGLWRPGMETQLQSENSARRIRKSDKPLLDTKQIKVWPESRHCSNKEWICHKARLIGLAPFD